MQEVVGSVHGHEVGRRFLADDEPVHEQHEVDRATEDQVGAGLRCGARPATSDSRAVASRDDDRRLARETKPSFKTTELIVYVLSVLGVLIASLVVDVNEDGQRFSAYQGWFLVSLLTIGYLISRGLAKSGSRDDTR